MEYQIVKLLHILSATILFGTGVGSAFYLLFVCLGRDVAAIAAVTRLVVVADYIFTASTAVFQPLSGFYMMHLAHFPITAGWLLRSTILYTMAILCWLPVVWLQIRLRDLAALALREQTALPPLFWHYLRRWTALGIPALAAFVAIFYLMVVKAG